MKLTLALFTLCAGLSLAGTAIAQSPPDEFRKLDRNSDGRLSIDEASAVPELRVKFKTLDRNRDGMLSPDEFAAWDGIAKSPAPKPVDPSTGPSGSSGAQHMPKS